MAHIPTPPSLLRLILRAAVEGVVFAALCLGVVWGLPLIAS